MDKPTNTDETADLYMRLHRQLEQRREPDDEAQADD